MNRRLLGIFAPVLLLTGIGGFLLPSSLNLMSRAAPYNVFHIVAGSVGILLVMNGREKAIRGFNLVFGLLDLYQALASHLHLFPERFFLWTRADDVLHIVLGLGLVAAALCRQ